MFRFIMENATKMTYNFEDAEEASRKSENLSSSMAAQLLLQLFHSVCHIHKL